MEKKEKQKTILTGLQPTGVITLGNYIGAIKQIIENQEKFDKSYLFIANLHAITVKQDPKELEKSIKDLLALYIACGVDPKKNIIFLQSDNVYHANMSWLLECVTYYGELGRMIQFKEKSKKNDNFTVGLLTYPVLMASDILLYDADVVPVGIDQKQHVELTRDIAIRFNKQYGKLFTIPEPLIRDNGTKIMDLATPDKKMSKSSESQKGVIRLLDDVETIRKKIMKATTDSENKVYFDMENKKGVSNLLNIYTTLTNTKMEEAVDHFKDKNYKEFKEEVADVVVDFVTTIQEKYNQILNSDELEKILEDGKKHTEKVAKEKYEKAKDLMGLNFK